MTGKQLRQTKHEAQHALEALSEIDPDKWHIEPSQESLNFVRDRLNEALIKLEGIDEKEARVVEETVRDLHNLISYDMSANDMDHVEDELLECKLILEGMIKEWENELSQQS